MNTITDHRADFWPLPLHAAALVVPFALLAAGTALDRAGGPPVTSYVGRVAADPGVYLASGMLLAAGMLVLVGTAAALVRLAVGTPRPALLRIGALLIGLWGVAGFAGVSLGYTAGWVSLAVRDDLPPAELGKVFEGVTYGPWAWIAAGGGGIACYAGLLVTGIGLLRAFGASHPAGWLVLSAIVVTLVGGMLGLPLVTSLGFVLAGVGLACTIPTLLRARPLRVAERDAVPVA